MSTSVIGTGVRRVALVAILVLVAAGCVYNWPQWGGGPKHAGSAVGESTLTVANVAGLHSLFTATLPDTADGAPAAWSGVVTAGGKKNLVFVTTRAGALVALDAHAGTIAWSKSFPAAGCKINNGGTTCYTTSSPAIDPSGLYVYTYGLDGKVHKVAIGTGTEVVDAHWPEISTLKGYDEKGSSSLAIATAKSGVSYLYMTHAGYPGDGGDYQGHVTVINLGDGSQKVFNTLCSNQAVHFVEGAQPDCAEVQSGVWARVGVVYDPDTDRVYLSSGNGTYAPASHQWGDTVSAIHPDGTGNASGDPVDAYTPTNYQQLDQNDIDLGSTAPAILPLTDTRVVSHLGVQSGKDGSLRLLDLDNLSGHGAPGFTGGEVSAIAAVPQGGEVLTTPVVWTNPADKSTWVFVANDNGTSALQVVFNANGKPSLSKKWQIAAAGTTPVVANGVIYIAHGTRVGAYNATTGASLWSDTSLSSIHWQSPVVANGVLYIEDGGGKLHAYVH